jgi:hypothetical protein
MTDFQVVEAKKWHCGQMVRLLRVEHAQVIAKIGLNSHSQLRACFDASAFRRAWMIDGRLAALGGVMSSALASTGMIWLAVSNEASRYPMAMVKEARKQIDEIMQVKRFLCTTIIDGDEASKRFAIFLGFVPSGFEMTLAASSRYGRRDLARQFEINQDARIPIGTGYAVTMNYMGRG